MNEQSEADIAQYQLDRKALLQDRNNEDWPPTAWVGLSFDELTQRRAVLNELYWSINPAKWPNLVSSSVLAWIDCYDRPALEMAAWREVINDNAERKKIPGVRLEGDEDYYLRVSDYLAWPQRMSNPCPTLAWLLERPAHQNKPKQGAPIRPDSLDKRAPQLQAWAEEIHAKHPDWNKNMVANEIRRIKPGLEDYAAESLEKKIKLGRKRLTY